MKTNSLIKIQTKKKMRLSYLNKKYILKYVIWIEFNYATIVSDSFNKINKISKYFNIAFCSKKEKNYFENKK